MLKSWPFSPGLQFVADRDNMCGSWGWKEELWWVPGPQNLPLHSHPAGHSPLHWSVISVLHCNTIDTIWLQRRRARAGPQCRGAAATWPLWTCCWPRGWSSWSRRSSAARTSPTPPSSSTCSGQSASSSILSHRYLRKAPLMVFLLITIHREGRSLRRAATCKNLLNIIDNQ